MTFQELEQHIHKMQAEGKKYFTTSSFQTHSLVLLHMLSKIDADIPVYFINTGYHFPETVAFRDQIMHDFGLTNLVDLKPLTPKKMQRGADGKMFFTSDPDYCCYLNKTQPMDAVLMQYDYWINGVRADQSKVRANMKVIQDAPHGSKRLHPMLDWNNKMILDYRKEAKLPEHPLEAKGYFSIGCEPCTRKFDLDMQERESRWYGMNKTECGLHTDLIK
jgi:phosphoadenosine phosphosulfate reductase